jgi:predicted lipase
MEHETIVDMLCITTLVYSFNEMLDQKKRVDEYTSVFGAKHDFKSLLGKYPKARVVHFVSDKVSDVQVGITVNDSAQRICVVFRGSNSVTDWRYNLQTNKLFVKKSPYGDIYIHNGFCRQLFMTNLYYGIFSQLQLLLRQYSGYKLFITGHSAGGALSSLFGYLLSCDMPTQTIQVVSFASPRIGNYAFKCDFEKKPNLSHIRVTNRNDIVTAAPFYKYWHVGDKVYIQSKKTSLCCCVNFSDHTSDSYHKNLLDTVW